MSAPIPLPGPATGQVCDRCRAKKIKCSGAVPACRNCVAAGTGCVVSAKLRRNTKLRGFQNDAEAEIARLRAENERLRRDLYSISEANVALRQHIEELKISGQTSDPSASSIVQTNMPCLSVLSQKGYPPGKSGLLIQHMGRLVVDEEGSERFAGSTTGVHFIWLVQQILQRHGTACDGFTGSCYRLHLLPSMQGTFPVGEPPVGLTTYGEELFMCLKQVLRKPLSVYTSHIVLFHENWSPFCPVIAKSDLIRHVAIAQANLQQDTTELSAASFAHCFQMVVIMLLNTTKAKHQQWGADDLPSITRLVYLMLPRVSARVDLMSLQGLAIFSLYSLVTGNVLSLPSLSGLLVRIGHFLGLHRHNRRFKLSAGHIELRKRLWWYIYFIDKMTSITLGLPQLIQDIDVDVDYPADCELEEVDRAHFTWPLPGEVSHTMGFLSLVHLSRILAAILEKLYTTTRRRNGPEKITQLRNDLLTWRQRFKPHHTDADNPGSAIQDNSILRLWLPIMDNFAMVLIHLPGLTFGETTHEFRTCLEHCIVACSAIINLACTERVRTGVLGIVPIGPSLLLQCGLMHVLYHSNMSTRDSSESYCNPLASKEILDWIIDTLGEYETLKYTSLNDIRTPSHTSPISDACQLLRNLSASVLTAKINTPDVIVGDQFVPLHSAPEDATFVTDSGSGFLETLNDVDFTNWAIDSPLPTLPDLT